MNIFTFVICHLSFISRMSLIRELVGKHRLIKDVLMKNINCKLVITHGVDV